MTNLRTVETITITGRLLKTRGLVIYVLLVLSALFFIFEAAKRCHTNILTGPSIGLFVSELRVVQIADTRWQQVAVGDVLIAINGIPITDALVFTRVQANLGPPATTANVRFTRGTQEWEETVAVTAFPIEYRIAAGLRLVTGSLLFFLGLGAFLIRPGRRTSWLFMLTCYTLGILALVAWLFLDDNLIHFAFQFVLMGLTAGVSLHLFSVFPRSVPFLAHHPRRVAIFYLPTLFLGPGASVQFIDHPFWKPLGTYMMAALWIWMALSSIGGLCIVAWQYQTAKRTHAVDLLPQYRAFLFAISAGLVAPALITNALVNITGLGAGGSSPWLLEGSIASLIVFAGVTGYAVVRHNALQVDRFTAIVVGYTAVLLLLGTGYGLLLVAVSLVLGGASLAESPVVLIVLTVVASMASGPLHRRIRRRIDRWFMRDHVDVHKSIEVLQRLGDAIQQGSSRQQSLDAALTMLRRTLPAEGVAVWSISDDGQQFVHLHGDMMTDEQDSDETDSRAQPPALQRTDKLARVLDQVSAAGVHGLAAMEVPKEAQPVLWAHRIAAVAPVRISGTLAGFIAVGRRRSGNMYSQDELMFLRAVATQIAFVLDRPADGDNQLGRYRIERRLGSGSFAEVFLAWQLGPGGFERKVALKRPHSELVGDSAAATMLLDEARIAAQLQHRNIAQIYEIDKAGASYFIAMEYVDGPSLRALIQAATAERQYIPIPIAVAIISAVLSALAYAHRQTDSKGHPLGFVHRDVSPSNILLNQRGEVKLVDFGIARASSKLYRTQTNVVRGTIPYMSLEQATKKAIDARSDLYSAAAVLYELLTLRRAFPMGPIESVPLRPPSHVNRHVPQAFDPILARGLAQRPALRFANAEAFCASIEGVLAPRAPAPEAQIATWMSARLAARVQAVSPATSSEQAADTALDATAETTATATTATLANHAGFGGEIAKPPNSSMPVDKKST